MLWIILYSRIYGPLQILTYDGGCLFCYTYLLLYETVLSAQLVIAITFYYPFGIVPIISRHFFTYFQVERLVKFSTAMYPLLLIYSTLFHLLYLILNIIVAIDRYFC